MKKLLLTLLVAISAGASSLAAQEPVQGTVGQTSLINNSTRDWQSTYQEESARDYIRRRAQEQSAARRARIEGMKWVGHSPSRPMVSATPFMSNPHRWVGVTPTGYWGPGFWSTRGMSYSPVWLH
jgi:hypothetical protein